MVKYASRVGGSVTKKVASVKRSAKKVLDNSSKGGSHLEKSILPESETDALTSGTNLQGYVDEAVGGAIPVKPERTNTVSVEDIENLTYPAMIQILHNMDNTTFGHLQGIAAAYLNMRHPLGKPLKHALGGSFDHPKTIAKIATRDVLKAPTSQRLAMALHEEWLDHMQGKNVGGGLFQSLKLLAKKGVSGASKALTSVGQAGKEAVKLLSKGTKAGTNIAKGISKAINQGLQIASVLEPAISAAFPEAGEVIKRTQASVKTGQEALERGIGIAEKVSSGLDPILQALGPIDAPLVELGPQPEFV